MRKIKTECVTEARIKPEGAGHNKGQIQGHIGKVMGIFSTSTSAVKRTRSSK
jgi:hypothetical protein